ncbi:MAG: glycosyltransferase family 2 protein [Patescibacteria group bacterium]
MSALSVIIPTRKRPHILAQCLKHLARQTIADKIEVIVIHDGEDDAETREALKAISHKLKAISFAAIPKSQQGVARNRGVDLAKAPVVLFIGDDILLEPGACEVHLRMHRQLAIDNRLSSGQLLKANCQKPIAILGFVTWDPSVGITPVMCWLEKSGWQFGYPKIEKYAHECIPPAIQHRFSYANNMSLPTDIAKQIRFREDVSLYGWEDIEWGLRLREAGVSLFYEPDAKALHHHRITLRDSLSRMEILGQSLPKISWINPRFDRVPRGWKLLAYHILSGVPSMRGMHYRAFLKGKHDTEKGIL